MNLDVNVDNKYPDTVRHRCPRNTGRNVGGGKAVHRHGMSESISIEIHIHFPLLSGNPVDGFMSLNLMTYITKTILARAARTAVQILNSRHQNLGDEPFMQQKAIDLTDMFGPIMDAVTAFVALVAGISCRRRNRRYEHHARIRHGTDS